MKTDEQHECERCAKPATCRITVLKKALVSTDPSEEVLFDFYLCAECALVLALANIDDWTGWLGVNS